jgi:hypothetical protein
MTYRFGILSLRHYYTVLRTLEKPGRPYPRKQTVYRSLQYSYNQFLAIIIQTLRVGIVLPKN